MRQFLIFLYVLLKLGNIFTENGRPVDSIRIHRYGSNVFKSGEIKRPEIKLPEIPEEKQLFLPHSLKDKYSLIQGDMLVESSLHERKKRKIVNEYDTSTASRTRWPNKIVPYEIDNSMPDEMVQRVKQAIEHWHARSCIRFEIYNPIRHKNYKSKLHMMTTENSLCASFVGYREDQPMYVSNVYLGLDCSLGSVIHELGHTIGFRHEQSRIDRNNHVLVNYNRVSDDFRGQYDLMENPQPNYYGVQYDLFSIMHYSGDDGVLQALDPKRNFLMGQRIGLSFLDIKLANIGYKCSEKCTNKIICQNEGFQDQFCKCYCPDGFSGQFCEIVISNVNNNNNVLSKDTDNINLNCDFDNTLCSWTQDRLRATDDWVFNKLSLNGFTETQQFFSRLDSTFKTGPQNGGDVDGKGGFYIYLNSLRKVTKDANAILMSPQIGVKTPFTFCLQFWYQMYQKGKNPSYPLKIGNLTLRQFNADGTTNVLWLASGNQSIDWKYGEADVTLKPPSGAIFFEAELDDYNYGDIALDKIRMKNSICNPTQKTYSIKWTDWSECSVSCGEGTKSRTKICDDSNPYCQPIVDIQPCIMDPCPVADLWSEWSDWSECSQTCDTGYYYRVRNCMNPDVTLCIGERTQYENCIIQSCNDTITVAKNTSIDNITLSHDQNSKILKVLALRKYQFELLQKDSLDECGGEYELSRGDKLKIKSPNYPFQYGSNLRCNYYIRSPSNTKILTKLLDIDLEESLKDTCIDGLEFRYFSLGQPGPVYCGRTQPQTAPFVITSYSNFTLIIFRSNWGQTASRRGFLIESSISN